MHQCMKSYLIICNYFIHDLFSFSRAGWLTGWQVFRLMGRSENQAGVLCWPKIVTKGGLRGKKGSQRVSQRRSES